MDKRENPFIAAISSGRIENQIQLKRIFRQLAKKKHPDTANSGEESISFINLKKDFEEANELLRHYSMRDFSRCAALFSELVATSFPIDKRARNGIYLDRINELNRQINFFGPEYTDLFFRVEEELYQLRGPSVISNHSFNLVKLYLQNLSDWLVMKNYFSRIYLKKSYQIVIDCLREKEANATITLIEWLLKDLQ